MAFIRVQDTLMGPAFQLINVSHDERSAHRSAFTSVMGEFKREHQNGMQSFRFDDVGIVPYREGVLLAPHIIDEQGIRERGDNGPAVRFGQDLILEDSVDDLIGTVIHECQHTVITQDLRLDINHMNGRRFDDDIILFRKK